MENPATWTPLHRELDELIRQVPPGTLDQDVALHKAIAEKLGLRSTDAHLIRDAIIAHTRAVSRGIIGLSLAGALINQFGPEDINA